MLLPYKLTALGSVPVAASGCTGPWAQMFPHISRYKDPKIHGAGIMQVELDFSFMPVNVYLATVHLNWMI